MENFNFIEFQQTRDFSRKMTATFEFIRQNFKPLFKSILFIAGPPVLVASLLFGSFFKDMMGFAQLGSDPDMAGNYLMSVSFWLQILLAFVFMVVSSVMGIATINNYILLYGEKKSNQIEVSEVWERVRATFWMYLGTSMLFVVVGIGLYIVLLIPMMLLSAISPALVVLGVIVMICVMVYLLFGVSLTFFVRAYEKRGFMEALGRSYWLVQGKWWSTFGLLMVTYLIMTFASYIFMIPMYAATVVTALHNVNAPSFEEPSEWVAIGMLVSFALYYLAHMFLSTLPNVAIAFQYFNLVERKEARGLMDSIETFGQDSPPANTAASTDEQY